MLDWLKKKIMASFISNLIRRALSWSGSAVVTAEILTKSESTTWEELSYKVMAGVVLILIDLAWSYIEKKYLKAALPMK